MNWISFKLFTRGVASPIFQKEEKDMKRLVLVLMAVGLFGAMPAFAADHAGMKMDTNEGARQCALQAESIQEKTKRLEAEIAKGEKEYDAKEIKKLNQQLDEANKALEKMLTGP